MEYTHDQHIGVYKNAFSNEWCDGVINYFQNNISNTLSRPSVYHPANVQDLSFPLNDKDLRKEFNDIFPTIFHIYQKKYPHILAPLDIEGYKIQKTLPTEGYHEFHIEHGLVGNNEFSVHRQGVYTVYLNDVKEGGETELLYQLKRIKPKKGTLCIFPAGYTHVHRGNTPLSGEKYIMTGWLTLPKYNPNGDKLRKG